MEGFNVSCKLLAIFKIKFLLPALFGWISEDKILLSCIAKNSGAELFVDQNASLVSGNTLCCGLLKAVVDDLLGRAICAVCSAVSIPFQPNMPVSNDPR